MSRKSILTELKKHTGTLELEQGKLYTQEDLDAECAAKYGPSWVWKDNLRCCVNDKVKWTAWAPLTKTKPELDLTEKKSLSKPLPLALIRKQKPKPKFTQKPRATKSLIEEISSSPIHQLYSVATKVEDNTQQLVNVTQKMGELEDAVTVFLLRWGTQIEEEKETLKKINRYLDKWL